MQYGSACPTKEAAAKLLAPIHLIVNLPNFAAEPGGRIPGAPLPLPGGGGGAPRPGLCVLF